jgi:hypothetical protein
MRVLVLRRRGKEKGALAGARLTPDSTARVDHYFSIPIGLWPRSICVAATVTLDKLGCPAGKRERISWIRLPVPKR